MQYIEMEGSIKFNILKWAASSVSFQRKRSGRVRTRGGHAVPAGAMGKINLSSSLSRMRVFRGPHISGVSFRAHLTEAFSKQNCAASALPSKANICKKEKKLQAHVTDDSIDRLLP